MLISYQFSNLFNQFGFIYLVGQFSDDQGFPLGAFVFFNKKPCPDTNRTSPGLVGSPYPLSSIDHTACGKIRARHKFNKLVNRNLGVIDKRFYSFDNFRQIVRWNISGHPHSDTGRPVDQQTGNLGGQHGRLK